MNEVALIWLFEKYTTQIEVSGVGFIGTQPCIKKADYEALRAEILKLCK